MSQNIQNGVSPGVQEVQVINFNVRVYSNSHLIYLFLEPRFSLEQKTREELVKQRKLCERVLCANNHRLEPILKAIITSSNEIKI